MVTHIVLFHFDSLNLAEAACEKLLSMKGRVPSLVDIEAGLDFTRSARSYELGLITRHKSREALEAYRVDPVHLEVVEFIKGKAQSSASVDFETAD